MTRPLIALIGAPDWAGRIAALLRDHGFDVLLCDDQARLVDQLADWHAALALVDGTLSDWPGRVARIKTDQATRRIPVLVIARDLDPDRAAGAGADGVLAPDSPDGDWLDRIGGLARGLDPAAAEALARQCGDDLPPLARLGVERFNAGAYYAQHDALEELWMIENGPVRELYRAILQVGVAYYHITRGNHAGALKMLRRSVQWLAILPDVCQGVDVRRLEADAARVRQELEAMDPAAIASFDRTLLQPVRLVSDDRPG
ncbi:MAG: DUF309 domain-containing protein [Chloroflexi bacterium]|nr:DUF309 domain-containing protein [Chloroflexota bacterium]